MATRNWTSAVDLLAGFGGTIADTDTLQAGGDGNAEHQVTTNVDQDAFDLTAFNVYESNRNRWGGMVSGSPVYVSLTVNQTGTGVFRWAGAGSEFWLKSSSVTGVINKVISAPVNNGTLYLGAMDCAELVVETGVANVGSECDFANAYFEAQVNLPAQTAGTAPVDIHCLPGSVVRCDRDISGDFYVYEGAQLWVRNSLVVPAGLKQYGGRVYWGGGNIPTLVGLAGVLDRAPAIVPITMGGTSARTAKAWVFKGSAVAGTTLSNHTAVGLGSRTPVA